jgi:DNA-binding helix-hairpin-helix protein with protein kinase domain
MKPPETPKNRNNSLSRNGKDRSVDNPGGQKKLKNDPNGFGSSMANYKDEKGKSISLGSKLGEGGEASVYLLNGEPDKVVKIFKPEKFAYYEPRLKEMVAHPPEDQTRKLTPPHVSIAWAERMVYENRQFVGYVMPMVKKAPDIFRIYSPKLRNQDYPNFDWKMLHHTACNLAIAVNAYHAAGYVIGDLNSKNVKVHGNAMVTMVDTDSIQVKTAGGQILRCPVGVAEYTSPEMQGIDFKSIDRDKYHDAFALSVMIFQLLMEGYHPFSGIPTRNNPQVTDPANLYCIKNGIYPYDPQNGWFAPPKFAPDYACLHPEIRALFDRCFKNASPNNRTNRPLPLDWYHALSKAEGELKQCQNKHYYLPSYGQCPWCKREAALGPRPKPKPKPQVQLNQQPNQQPIQKPLIQPNLNPQKTYTQPKPYTQPTRQSFDLKAFYRNHKKAITWVSLGIVVLGMALFFTFSKYSPFQGISISPEGINITTNNSNNSASNNSGSNQSSANSGGSLPAGSMTPIPTCPHAPTLTLNIGETVYVNSGAGLRGHSQPNLSSDNVVVMLTYGAPVEIVDGPVCVNYDADTAYWFWQVRDENGVLSWVAEGDRAYYYLRR